MGTDSPARRLREVLEPLLAQEAAARALSNEVPRGALFVGLSGIEVPDAGYEITPDLLLLRRVTNPPSLVHIYPAAEATADPLPVSRYSQDITAELVVGNPEAPPDEREPAFLHKVAWHAVALMKLAGAADLFAPASADCSWDTIAGRRGDVRFHTLDDAPRRLQVLDAPAALSMEDIEWIDASFRPAFELRDAQTSRRFGLAFGVAYSWTFTSDVRMGLANLWTGIEALFGDQADRPVTKALVNRVSSWTGDISSNDIEALYDRRCDAVHGRWVDRDDLIAPLRESWDLLRRSLVLAIERQRVPLPDWVPRGV